MSGAWAKQFDVNTTRDDLEIAITTYIEWALADICIALAGDEDLTTQDRVRALAVIEPHLRDTTREIFLAAWRRLQEERLAEAGPRDTVH